MQDTNFEEFKKMVGDVSPTDQEILSRVEGLIGLGFTTDGTSIIAIIVPSIREETRIKHYISFVRFLDGKYTATTIDMYDSNNVHVKSPDFIVRVATNGMERRIKDWQTKYAPAMEHIKCGLVATMAKPPRMLPEPKGSEQFTSMLLDTYKDIAPLVNSTTDDNTVTPVADGGLLEMWKNSDLAKDYGAIIKNLPMRSLPMVHPISFKYKLEKGFPEEIKVAMFKPATPGSIGFDVYNYSFTEGKTFSNVTPYTSYEPCFILNPGVECKINTGVSLELPPGYGAFLYKRSSTSRDLQLCNTVGVIDTDYRGNIIVKVQNTGMDPIKLNRWERLFQLVILEVPKLVGVEVEELTPTTRGDGGFGSTGTGPVENNK